MAWRDELQSGRVLLREIIDLEQTYGGINGTGQPGADGTMDGAEAPVPAEAAEPAAGGEGEGEEGENEEDFDDGAGPTVSAMEAELREGVMATLDAIADEFEAFRKLQE